MSYAWGPRAEVAQNQDVFLQRHGYAMEQCVMMEVEHGDRIAVVDASAAATTVTTEALITTARDIVLFLVTADCLPIVLCDAKRGVLALAHVGWKPTGLRLIEKVIAQMRDEAGAVPADVVAYIGPSIHGASYVVTEVAQAADSGWAPYLRKLSTGETSVDLHGYNIKQMLAQGVRAENIHIDHTDTVVSPKYFSHYRCVRTGEQEGRFATIAALR